MSTENDLEHVKALLEGARFKFAKTMPKNPHEYTLRETWNNADFDFVVTFIREHGYPYRFWSKTYIQLDLGDYFYWTMGAPLEKTILINRKPLTAKRPY